MGFIEVALSGSIGQCIVVWSVEHVHGLIYERGLEGVTDEVAEKILLNAFENHDRNIGINWDSLEFAYLAVTGGE